MNYAPLKMHPVYKEALWGGDRLKWQYGKPDAPEITAESWELAAHPSGMSRVAEGPYAGMTVRDLGERDCTGFWGENCRGDEFPILVKLIDAAKDLSVQVHPSDVNAVTEQGERGKAEMWYIVDCKPQASLYLGFSRRVSREELLARAADGSICEVLNRVSVQRGDVFSILPGTIHAIGAGVLVAEIQQNSDTTFRVYDYCRRDANGNLRPLHLARAAEVMNYEPIIPSECRANSMAVFPEFTISEMFSCRYFKAHRLDLRTEARLCCDGLSFRHLLCVEGEGEIVHHETIYPFCQGDSFFLPAAMGEYIIRGTSRMLISRV